MRGRLSTIKRFRAACIVLAILFVGGGIGCGGNSPEGPTVEIDLFGWSENGGFVKNLSDYPAAQVINVKLTQPSEGRIVSSSQHDLQSGSAEIPELTFGEGVRLDFDLIDGQGERVGSASTLPFSLEPDSDDQSLQAMVVPTEDFAPVGAQYCVDFQDGDCVETGYSETEFDSRAFGDIYPGRVGHEAVTTSSGNALIVGGGHAIAASPSGEPPLDRVFGDLQLFDPNTGYTTDLAFDEEASEQRPDGADRLEVARAYHTVTRVGEDRFLVVGGLTLDGDDVSPTSSIELIDLRAAPGERVRTLADDQDESLKLGVARAQHTATYRRSGNHVVVAGGIGSGGANDVLNSIEVIDLSENTVETRSEGLAQPRAQHEAVRMGDEQESIWIIGGRHSDPTLGGLASSELLRPCENRTICFDESVDPMSTGRYDFGAVQVDRGLIAVCGGYTTSETNSGDPTATCQIGRLDRTSWSNPWTMTQSRGGMDLVALSQSRDLVGIGGKNGESETIESVVHMNFERDQAPPYSAQPRDSSMFDTRYDPTVTGLENGLILLTGGHGRVDGGAAPLQTLEYYNPADVVRAREFDSQSDQ